MFKFLSTMFSGITSKVMLVSVLGLGVFNIYQYLQNDRINDKLKDATNSLTILDQQHKTLKDQYAGLEKQLKQLEESNKITSDILDSNTKTKVIYKDRFDLVDQKVTAQVNEIKKKYADKEKSTDNKKAEEAEISNVRINGLWSSFCANENTPEQCLNK